MTKQHGGHYHQPSNSSKTPDAALLRSAFETPSSSNRPMTPPTEELTPSTSPARDREEGYLGDPEEYRIRTLFRAEHDNFTSSSRRHKRSSPQLSRRSARNLYRARKSRQFAYAASSSSAYSSDSSPDRSNRRRSSSPLFYFHKDEKYCRIKTSGLLLILCVASLLSIGLCVWSANRSIDDAELLQQYERRFAASAGGGGLRGKLVQMAGNNKFAQRRMPFLFEENSRHQLRPIHVDVHSFSAPATSTKNTKASSKKKQKKEMKTAVQTLVQYLEDFSSRRSPRQVLEFSKPPLPHDGIAKFDALDSHMYVEKDVDDDITDNNQEKVYRRQVVLGGGDAVATPTTTNARSFAIQEFPSDFTDNTQYYGLYDSDDTRLSHMEMREPLDDGECVAMQDWQTTYHPSCNMMHELGLEHMGEFNGDDFNLFGTKGYWRNAWRVDSLGGQQHYQERETVVLKTLKFQHNFEDAHFEHDRIDAVAMERLTSSPHVINVFSFCGHSVMTEFADGSRLGELADKAKKKPLARLSIARDIAMGLADVHGIDGEGNATFVHLDINPANVVSIGGTLKLNDFNIGILTRWNTTSQSRCGFPAQYPNPQWRSPEEARNEQDLTEKVDIFSMGHIFFRLICGHEPWNKLEVGGKPTKEEINDKVQRGIMPRIPDDIMATTNKEVAAVRDAMLACYTADPLKRPSARTIANHLQRALEILEQGS